MYTAARVEHHDRARVRLRDGLDELVLVPRQFQGLQVAALGGEVAREDDRDVGRGRGAGRRLPLEVLLRRPGQVLDDRGGGGCLQSRTLTLQMLMNRKHLC